MSFQFFLAKRLKLNPNNTNGGGVSVSVVIALTGIALSVVVMLISLCITRGFQHEIKQKVYGFDSHVTIYPANDDGTRAEKIILTPRLDSIISATGCFNRPQLLLQESAVIKTDSSFQAIAVRNLAPETSAFIEAAIVEGQLPHPDSSQSRIVISRPTASSLGLNVGNRIYVYFFIDGAVKTRRMEVSGIYDTHFSDYDKALAFTTTRQLHTIASTDETTGNQINLTTVNPGSIGQSAMTLRNAMINASYHSLLDGAYTMSTIEETAILYFNWLDLLNTNVAVILALMIIVSTFTLISSLFILVLERVSMIGLLKALGATNRSIRHIFIYMAGKLVVGGIIIGNTMALPLLLIQQHYRLLPLNPDSYYLSFVPVAIDWLHVALLNGGVFVVSWLVILLPSQIIAKISPSKAIRYE